MPQDYSARKDDCISSIAFAQGLLPDTIWKHANNAALKSLRKDPNILQRGDQVHIPDMRRAEIDAATDTKHRFRRKAVPEKIRLILLDDGDKPRSGVPYTLTIDGQTLEGSTGGDGSIEHPIPPDARTGSLRLREGEGEVVYQLCIGELDPVSETSGIQMRLRNLNLYSGEIDGELTERTQAAIEDFQTRHQLEATGNLDSATRDKIKSIHGS